MKQDMESRPGLTSSSAQNDCAHRTERQRQPRTRGYTPTSTPDHSIRPHPGASSFRQSPTVVHGPRELSQEFTTELRNAYHEPFTAWTQGGLDEMVRRKKEKDARPTYKTIARSLQKRKFTTLRCIGLVTAQEHHCGLPHPAGFLCVLLYLALS